MKNCKDGLNNFIILFLIIHELENKDDFCFYNSYMFSQCISKEDINLGEANNVLGPIINIWISPELIDESNKVKCSRTKDLTFGF